MENMVIAIDNGKMYLKLVGANGKEYCYRNAYSIGDADTGMLGSKTFNAKWQGCKYTVGENGGILMSGEGKGSDSHVLSALVGITHYLDPKKNKNEKIYVTYGESFTKYLDKDNRNEIIEKLEKAHSIEVGGEQYDFEIAKLHILPEGIGHILSNLEKYRGLQYVIDIGGTTINFLLVRNGMPIPESCTSFELGVHVLRNEIIRRVNQAGYARLYDLYADEMLKDYCEDPRLVENEDVREVIGQCIASQFRELDSKLAGMQFKIQEAIDTGVKISFTGGGSELLKRSISETYVGAHILEDAIMTNVRGFYQYGVAKYGNFR